MRRQLQQLRAPALLALSLILLPGCRPNTPSEQPSQKELTVSAAVSLKDAFNELAKLNEQRNGTKIHFNYGASGALQKQIESGAPVDVFASAGAKQMDDLAAKSLIVSSSRKDFARNALVLITPASGAGFSFADLTKAEVKKIAMGNPKTVPAGQYTEQTLTRLKLLPQIQPKLIYAEDVRQVLDYLIRGEVDAGLVYRSDAISAGAKVRVVATAPDDSHDPILYPIALVKQSQSQVAAQQFIDLVVSGEGQAVLARNGFASIKIDK